MTAASTASAPRVRLLGVSFDAITSAETVDRVADGLRQGEGGWVVTPNVDILRQVVSDPVSRSLVESATLVVADGMPLVWASRLQGTPLPERVAGSDLVWSIPRLASLLGARMFLLGGEPGAAARAAARMTAQFPTLQIAGTLVPEHGFDQDEQRVAEIVSEVREASPDVVFVALGFPKQERLIAELRPVLPRAWMFGVGISLSFVAGDVRRAPRWIQVLGMEWVHRFAQEPRRLARRYLVLGVPFAVRLLMSSARTRARRPGPLA